MPSLRRLVFHAGQLGSVDSQLVHEGILKSSIELKRYHDFPGRFSGRCHSGRSGILARLPDAPDLDLLVQISKLTPFSYRYINTFGHKTHKCINIMLKLL